LLAHEREQVRLGAPRYTLVNIDKARAARREIGALAGDKAWSVRKAFADLAGGSGTRRSSPPCCACCGRHPAGARGRQSLARPHPLPRRAGRVLGKLKKQGGGTRLRRRRRSREGAEGPAETTRLMAIDLARHARVAETLPFLIDLCSDGTARSPSTRRPPVKRINR
jgi:hypothetical protein